MTARMPSPSGLRSTRTRAALVSAFVVLTGAMGVPALVAEAQPPPASGESASDHFGRGVAFYKDGDFTAAMVEFKRAYEIEPSYPVLYNIGQTSRELRDYASALTAFQKYLAEGAKATDQSHINAHREKVQGYVDELKPKIAIVTIAVTIPGADISVDDVSIGTSPLDKPVNVNAGRRKISATKSGYLPAQKFVDVGGTDQKTVNMELIQPGGDSRPNPIEPKKPPPDRGPLLAASIATVSITAAVGIATIGIGVKSISAKNDFQAALAKFPGNGSDIEAKRSTAKTFALAADITGGVTIAGAITSVVLFATYAGAKKSDAAADTKAMIVPVIGPGTVGVAGTF